MHKSSEGTLKRESPPFTEGRMSSYYLPENDLINRRVEQLAARLAHNQKVAGSSPASATKP